MDMADTRSETDIIEQPGHDAVPGAVAVLNASSQCLLSVPLFHRFCQRGAGQRA
jgi:hypothetical protein